MRPFDACLAELHARPRYAKKLDLSRIQALMQALGNPQEKLKFIHVAGTNGKGSICAMTASVLRAAGFRVGLYTSPYLRVFEERIQVNGALLPQDDFCRLYERVYAAQCALEAQGGDPANEFEVTTAVGMLWFLEQRCDWVVLEVGLGGRLDATNVIPPQTVSCIAQIGLDHTAQLGGTIREVAGEKAGIIKPGSTVITSYAQEPEALEVFRAVCAERGATLLVTSEPEAVQPLPDGTRFRYGGAEFCTTLAGSHQAANASCVIEICRTLGVPQEAILRGLKETAWPGRLQLLQAEPAVVLDCGHNPNGIEALLKSLDEIYLGQPTAVLMAMMQDKDYACCVHAMARRAVRFYATTLDMPRALGAEALRDTAAERCGACIAEPDPALALQRAVRELQPGELLVICGSVYLAGEILKITDELPVFDKK